jgi:hypothetical protein
VNEIESTFVKPFYLKMMGVNAVRATDELWADVVSAGRTVTADEVNWLLGTALWRPVVMGAWFSVTVPAEAVSTGLVAAMSQSRGSLTAPALAAAATVVAGAEAVPGMIAYLDFMMSRPDGSENVVAAAVEYLGAEAPMVPSEAGRQAFRDVHGVAVRLRDAVR